MTSANRRNSCNTNRSTACFRKFVSKHDSHQTKFVYLRYILSVEVVVETQISRSEDIRVFAYFLFVSLRGFARTNEKDLLNYKELRLYGEPYI